MEHKISIIIPVYNAEKTIERCIKSILCQLNKNIEIIVVNDGSKDDSEKIIKEIQKDNPIIKYFYKENSGVADTRNYGIDKASGDYITFVDSDDYIAPNYVETIKPLVNKDIEMIKYKLKKIGKERQEIEKIDGPVFEKVTGEEAFNILYSTDVLIDSPCVYVIKKDIITRNNFKFQGTYHEDFGLIPLILVSAKSVISIPHYLYLYVQESNSITRNYDYNKTIKKMQDVLFHYDNMLKVLDKMEISKTTLENIKIYYTNAIILKLESLKKEDKKKFIKKSILNINVNLYLKIR